MDALIGNARAKRYLEHMLQTGRTGHALLFAGPAGVGKDHFALAFAKRLASPHDIHHYAPEGKAAMHTIESLRQLSAEVSLAPHAGERKVFIVKSAERMRPAAANALLKTLEEPTPGTLIILITAHREQILPTLLSRCRTLYFQPIPTADIAEHLGIDLHLAERARGSLARAKKLADQEGSWKLLQGALSGGSLEALSTCAEKLAGRLEERGDGGLALSREIDYLFEEMLLHFRERPHWQLQKIETVAQKSREAIRRHGKLSHCLEAMLLGLTQIATLSPSGMAAATNLPENPPRS